MNLAERHRNRLRVDPIDLLRQVFRQVKDRHPFTIDTMVVLSEHLHCIRTLPEGDSDDETRWALIKAGFSRRIPGGERRSESRVIRGERGIRQRRYWEHLIRDDAVRSSPILRIARATVRCPMTAWPSPRAPIVRPSEGRAAYPADGLDAGG